jgi:uncharacterized protein YbjT (DUF2867 family)
MPVYAVTGASGHLGRFAIEQLLARGVPPSEVVAVVRDRGKATSLAGRGVTVREADYSRPETLGAALAGVNRLLLVSSSELSQLAAQHRNVITAAQTAGVSRASGTRASSMPMTRPARWPASTAKASGHCGRRTYRSPCCATATTRRSTPIRSASTSRRARSSARPATAGSRRPRARTTPPPLPRHCSTTREGTGPTSSAARPSACRASRGSSPRSPAPR